jgi:hypothetical protein
MTTPKPSPPRFVLHVTALPRDGDLNATRRLKAALKLLLRSFGFRCTSIEYPAATGTPDDEYAIPFAPPEGMERRDCGNQPPADATPSPVNGYSVSAAGAMPAVAADAAQAHTFPTR